MKRKLTFLLTAVLLLATAALPLQMMGQTRDGYSYTFTAKVFDANNQTKTLNGIDWSFAGTGGEYFGYDSTKGQQFGSGSKPFSAFTLSTSGISGTITQIKINTSGANSIAGTLNVTVGGNAFGDSYTLTNTATEVTFSGSASGVISFNYTQTSSKAIYIKSIVVTYTAGGGQETVATPTFSPGNGTYFETQSVSISCATEGATIRYTLDETEPTESSAIYSAPISVNTTTTIKAKAFKSGYTASTVATATYTFPTLITIAEARALADNEYALVQGIVTFIDGRNVYIQDATAGIDLYLNTNASGINLGDEVKGYGKKTVYNGLVELTGINQSSSAFAVVSTGNTLPVAVKTIAEINAGGSGALQSTRVKIESATMGATTGNNTVISQGSNAINIFKMPTLTGIEEGDEVDVIGVVGYFNAAQMRVASASDIVLSYIPNPQLAVTPTQLNGFTYIFNNGPSASQTFTVSGSDLDNDVSITAPYGFEVSNANDYWFDSFVITPTQGTVNAMTVYVRMKSGLAVGNHTGNVSVACGTLSATVALSGTVSEQPTAATPTFTPNGGEFITAQTVSMSCTTEGAVIHYTTDGSTPDENSATYSTPITVNTTTTIKAIAVADGYQNSAVGEATITIYEVVTIATARALANNQYACVEGTVTYIDGRNVYIQDATAGIDLYLNTNTVPSTLTLGDNVRAYGKKTVYNGLVELTGIAGNNDNVFTVISSGNSLPLATKTIAEINTDYSGNNLLQATRVKIENAIIGAINPSSTTVITQDGNAMNVFHIPTVEGMIQGDWVTLTGVIGCYNAPQLLVASASDIQYTHRPTLTADPISLSGFTYEFEQGGPSELQSFVLAGDYMIGPVSVNPSASFEVSTFGGASFHPEDPAMIYLTGGGHFYNINVYVRLKAGLEGGTYNEQIAIASQDADTLFVNVTGTVTGGTPTPPDPPTPPTPGDGNYIRISDLGELTEGAYVVFAARFDDIANNYYAMSNTSSGKPTGVLFTSATADENEVLPASITDEEESFYWIVGVTANGYTFTNAAGELIGYSSSTNFYTGGDNTEWSIESGTSVETAMVPNYTGFVITNVNNESRAFALNTSHNFGPYAKSNMSNNNAGSYNFFLDLFVKTEGGTPPTPTVATPTFTPAAGTYFEEQSVAIACATDGATIYYSTASENGPWTEYEGAITVSESMTLWAYAEKEGYNDSPVAEAEYVIQLGFVTIFNQDWEGEMNGWTFVDVEGEMSWTIASYQNNHYAYANGYNHGANEDWCISPAFNLDAYDNPMLSFRTATKFDGNVLQVFFSNDYDGEDPTEAIWTSLDCELSTGNYTWVESGDIDLSAFSGSNCYIGFKYTCEESQAAAWEVDDILLVGQTSDPVVTVTPLTLTGFTYAEGNGPSDEQSFTVSGLNLSNNITIAEASDYEISLGSGSSFVAQSTLTLSTTGGNLEETTIYVRLKAGLAVGDYNDEDITVACADVDDIDVNCSGNVTEQPVPGGDYVRISDVSQLAAGNRVIIAARYNDTEDAYLAAANTLTSGKLTTTEFTSQMNGDDEIIPASIMADEDSFYWTVDITSDGYTFTNANGDMIGYGTSGTNFNFSGSNTSWTIESGVADTASMVPEYNGFLIANVTTNSRAFAIRYYNEAYICGAYSTSNINNGSAGEYNFFLDIFMQGEGGTCTVAAPTFDPEGGTYYETQEVTLNCVTSDATIWYSLESETGPWSEYEEAITVDENMTLWAYATKEGCNDSPVVSAEYVIQNDIVIIFNQDWEEDWHGWTEVLETGDSLWRIASYQGNHYAYANGYNHPATIDWLISPAFDLDSYSDVVLTFRTAKNYTGEDIHVYFSNDYDGQDPTGATWEELECALSTGSWTWTESGEINLDDFNGTNCYIGFMYSCTDDEAAGWEVDDILLVSGGGAAPVPTLTATPNTINGLNYLEGEGPSNSQSYTLTGANLEGEGNVTVTAPEYFEISLDDETFVEAIDLPFANGEIVDQPVTIYVRLMEGLEVGTYEDVIAHEGGNATTEVSVTGTVRSEEEPYMLAFMPYYIQGNNGSNNNRVPVATAAYILNLEPNTTYRYTNQFVDGNDGPETAGAGNVIYAAPEGFYRSTSPSLSTEGGYGEFTTDEDGIGFAWFMNEPTANARFTPGNQVYLRVRINDGNDGTTVEHIFTSDDYATVLNFGTEYDEYSGSAFYVMSNEAPMSFAMMMAGDEDERPLYSTSIETTGVDYGSINQYADFYKELVAGNDGWFGGILPNDNKAGVTSILILDIDSYIINEYYSEDGLWYPEANTVNPTNGLDEPLFIDLTYDGVEEPATANVKVWNADLEFVIENGDNAHYSMTVYNVLGQPIMKKQINAGSTERISHSLASGVYIISLQNNQNKVSVKVIVK